MLYHIMSAETSLGAFQTSNIRRLIFLFSTDIFFSLFLKWSRHAPDPCDKTSVGPITRRKRHAEILLPVQTTLTPHCKKTYFWIEVEAVIFSS